MHTSNRFVIVCNIRIVIRMLKKYIDHSITSLIPVGRSRSSELCFLDILSTNKHFYHYFCVISISKYM